VSYEVRQGDCLEIMRTLRPGSNVTSGPGHEPRPPKGHHEAMTDMNRDQLGVLLCEEGWESCLATFSPEAHDVDEPIAIRAAELLASSCAREMATAFYCLGSRVQSPQEKAFLIAFVLEACKAWGWPCTKVVTCPSHQPVSFWGRAVGPVDMAGRGAYVVCPQHHVDQYRVDFLIWSPANGDNTVAVEIDGHDFHEKTKHQVVRDKRRERAIVATGLKVLRFSGSEIFKDACSCAKEALAILDSRERKG